MILYNTVINVRDQLSSCSFESIAGTYYKHKKLHIRKFLLPYWIITLIKANLMPSLYCLCIPVTIILSAVINP